LDWELQNARLRDSTLERNVNGENEMKGKLGGAAAMSLTIAISALPFATASAQWTMGSFGVAEYDTKQTLLLLAGVSASPKGEWEPTVGLQAYHLSFESGSARTNVFAVRPGVGVVHNYNGGDMSATIGYQFTTNNNTAGPVTAGERGQGVDASFGWDEWGTGGPLGYQVLGSYNFGSKSFWGRGRLTTRVSENGASSTRVGAEVAYLSGTGYSAVQPGAVVEFHMPAGQILGLGAGMKFANTGGNAVYFRVEGFLPLLR